MTLDDAMNVGIAVRNSDTPALAGLLARGKAFEVAEGTQVHSGGEIDYGICLVNIESGSQIGRRCYIPTNALR